MEWVADEGLKIKPVISLKLLYCCPGGLVFISQLGHKSMSAEALRTTESTS